MCPGVYDFGAFLTIATKTHSLLGNDYTTNLVSKYSSLYM